MESMAREWGLKPKLSRTEFSGLDENQHLRLPAQSTNSDQLGFPFRFLILHLHRRLPPSLSLSVPGAAENEGNGVEATAAPQSSAGRFVFPPPRPCLQLQTETIASGGFSS